LSHKNFEDLRMKTKAKIAVVGTGWWATYTHLPALQTHPGVAEIVLCDSNADKLDAAAEAYHIEKRYTDVQAMLQTEDLDGAVIATNHASHFALAQACLDAGVHVMIEKPLTLYARDAKALIDLAAARGVEIIMGYPYHFTKHVNHVRQVIQSGELGAIQMVNCFMASNVINLFRGDDGSSRRADAYPVHGPGSVYSQPHLSGGGQGHLQVTHAAGLMFFVTGLQPKRVHALMNNHGLPVDLVDAILVEFAPTSDTGIPLGVVSSTGNQATPGGGMVDLQVYCEKGSLDMNVISGTVRLFRSGSEPEIFEVPAEERYPRMATSQNLVDVVLGQASNGSPVEAGWRTVELLDAAYRSAAADGARVLISDLYEAH
jgi:predicted dehydrogenase